MLDKTELPLMIGNEDNLTATVVPDSAADKTVSWSSDKPNIAKVENGKVTALAEGTATITATTANGKSATCTVTVTAPLTNAEIKAYLDKNYVDDILNRCMSGLTINKENLSNETWYIIKDTDGNIIGAEYAFKYNRSNTSAYFSIGKIQFTSSVNVQDIRDGKKFNPAFTTAYIVNYNPTIQTNRADLTNAICDKVFGENATATRYIANERSSVDATLGMETRVFKVIEITDSSVKETTINVKDSLNDAGLIANLNTETNYRTYSAKSYELSGTKLVVEN